MKKKIAILLILVFFASILIPNLFRNVNAQVLGGNDYSNAVELVAGSHQLGTFTEDISSYYSITIPTSEELKIDYTFQVEYFIGDVTLFDENRQELAGWDEGTGTIRWLNDGKNNTSTKVYLVISNAYETANCELTVSFVNRQDSADGFDAGGDYDNATPINYGEYTGYISNFVYGNEGGNDKEDYYQLTVKKGDTITVKITPDGKNITGLGIYNSKRDELFLNDGGDLTAGEIIQQSFQIQGDGILYIVVGWPFFDPNEGEIVKYTMLVTNTPVDGNTVTIDTDDDEGDDDDTITVVTGNEDIINKDSTKKTDTRNLLIGIFVVVLCVLSIIFIVVLLSILAKKKKSSGSLSKNDSAEDSEAIVEKNTETSSDDSTKDQIAAKQKVEVTVEEGTEVNVKTVPDDLKDIDENTTEETPGNKEVADEKKTTEKEV